MYVGRTKLLVAEGHVHLSNWWFEYGKSDSDSGVDQGIVAMGKGIYPV